jgi:hypothetical protein
VVPGHKLDFALTTVTQLLQQHGSKAIAVIILPNRSSAKDIVKKKRQITSSSVQVTKDEADSGSSDDDEEEPDSEGDPATELATIHHDIMVQLSSKERRLRVRQFSVLYSPASVYGQRSMTASCVMAVAAQGASSWTSTRLWRLQGTDPVMMLPREQMLKPARQLTSGVNFTDAQERRQWHSGHQVVEGIMSGLLKDEKQKVIMIDLHAYDASTAESIILRNAHHGGGNSCVSLAHEADVAQVMADKVGQLLFDQCRAKNIMVPGFPEFDPVVKELQDHHQRQLETSSSHQEYKVCKLLANGVLAVLDTHIKQWTGHSVVGDKFQALLEAHNKEFNPSGLSTTMTKEDADDNPGDVKEEEPPLKKARIMEVDQDIKTEEELLKNHTDMSGAQCLPWLSDWSVVQ